MSKMKRVVLFCIVAISFSLSSQAQTEVTRPNERDWRKEMLVYEVYPRSFADSNADGIGDIQGIIRHLDYIKSLGADMVWIWSLYRSPNVDNGYDVSDYYSINPEFGTMADFDQLVREMHERGLKLQMELVSNHSSDEHPWFQESRKSRDNPYRDYYFWRPPKNGGPPNDWQSLFGGSAWQFDPATNEYYLHYFNKKQVDLNWDNPKLREEIYKIERFWLDKGVDGFRMDVITLISKDPTFRNLGPRGIAGYEGGPHEHEYLQEMNREVLSHYDISTVGEGAFVSIESLPMYTAEDRHELNMLFLFDHFGLGRGEEKYSHAPFDLKKLKAIVQQWYDAITHSGWNATFLESGDMPRVVSAWGDDGKYRVASADMLATFLLTLAGTPYIYQGQEIGMTNARFPSLKDFRDLGAERFIDEMRAKHIPDSETLERLNSFGRDNTRTPMQWNRQKNAGFSTADQTWINVNANYREINVQAEESDRASVLNYYRRMIRLRKSMPLFVYGEYLPIETAQDPLFAYVRRLGDKQVLVVLNFSAKPSVFHIPGTVPFSHAKLLLSNEAVEKRGRSAVHLKPYQALIYQLKPAR